MSESFKVTCAIITVPIYIFLWVCINCIYLRLVYTASAQVMIDHGDQDEMNVIT